jgi:hypothetical protein
MLGDRPTTLGLLRLALGLSIAGFSGCLGPNAFHFRGTTASSFMKTIEESKDPNARYFAYDKLASSRTYENDEQKTRAAQLLTAKLKSGSEPIATRAVICRTLGMLGKPVARDVILAATSDEDPLVRAEACRSLGRVGRPEDATVLAQVMTIDTADECRVAAIESLGALKSSDRRITEMLVAGMEDPKPVIRVACLAALRSMTGKDLGVDALAWKKFVDPVEPPSTAPSISTGSIPDGSLPRLPDPARELPPEIP